MGEEGKGGITIATSPTQKTPPSLQEEKRTVGAAAIKNLCYVVIPALVESRRLNMKPGTTGCLSQIPPAIHPF